MDKRSKEYKINNYPSIKQDLRTLDNAKKRTKGDGSYPLDLKRVSTEDNNLSKGFCKPKYEMSFLCKVINIIS